MDRRIDMPVHKKYMIKGATVMKVFVYSYREFDEAEWFTHFSKEYGIELGTSPDAPDS